MTEAQRAIVALIGSVVILLLLIAAWVMEDVPLYQRFLLTALIITLWGMILYWTAEGQHSEEDESQ